MIVAGFAGGDGLWHALRSSNAPISAAATTLCGRVTYAAGRDWESGTIPSRLRCPDCARLSGLLIEIDQPEPPTTPPPGALAHESMRKQALREIYRNAAEDPLEALLVAVWSCEADWRLDDRIAVAGKWS